MAPNAGSTPYYPLVSQITGRKRVAALYAAIFQAIGKPPLALRTGAVGKAFRHHRAPAAALQSVIANAGCCVDRFFYVALL